MHGFCPGKLSMDEKKLNNMNYEVMSTPSEYFDEICKIELILVT